jgi:hypothetical protein
VNKERGERRIREGETLGKGTTFLGSIIFIWEDCITGLAGGACWRIVLLVLLEELVGGLSQGAPVAGNFGLGGQETIRNPGAREPDRLFLAGWEVSQFWESLDRVGEQHHLGQSWRTTSV